MAKVPSPGSTTTVTSPLATVTPPPASSCTATGWSSGLGANRAHPNPGTACWRASTRRMGGWSRAKRTSVSGRAVSRV